LARKRTCCRSARMSAIRVMNGPSSDAARGLSLTQAGLEPAENSITSAARNRHRRRWTPPCNAATGCCASSSAPIHRLSCWLERYGLDLISERHSEKPIAHHAFAAKPVGLWSVLRRRDASERLPVALDIVRGHALPRADPSLGGFRCDRPTPVQPQPITILAGRGSTRSVG
jgi:hypothetical protein